MLVFLVIAAGGAPAQAQFADFSILSTNHASRTIQVQASIFLCFPTGGNWRFTWGDDSETKIGSNVIGKYSHTFSNWGQYTITLHYHCYQRGATSTSRTITLKEPAATAAPTNTPVPFTVSFDALRLLSGRIFIFANATRANADIVCGYSGAASGSIRCPQRTLVSFPFSGCGTVNVTATAREGGDKATASGEVSVLCAPTATPTPLPAGSAALAVASKSDANRTVGVSISQSGCTGTGTWTVSWGDGGSTDIPSPYSAQPDHSYSNWGAFIITLSYTCQGGAAAEASANVALIPPTATPTATPMMTRRPRGPAPTRAASGLWGAPRALAPARLPIPTQDHSCLPLGAEVNSGSPWISFCEVDRAGIGMQSVLDEGARSAIDVWGPLGVEAEVCFAGAGSLILLDAAYSPRQRMPLTSYARGGKTCGYLDRPGTVVLMPGAPDIIMAPATATPPAGLAHAAAGPVYVPGAKPLSNCLVHSLFILNFRETPEGRIMSWFSGTGTALARTDGWWQIVYNGEIGWVSADPAHSYGFGDCA